SCDSYLVPRLTRVHRCGIPAAFEIRYWGHHERIVPSHRDPHRLCGHFTLVLPRLLHRGERHHAAVPAHGHFLRHRRHRGRRPLGGAPTRDEGVAPALAGLAAGYLRPVRLSLLLLHLTAQRAAGRGRAHQLLLATAHRAVLSDAARRTA